MYGGRFIVTPAGGKVWGVQVRYPKDGVTLEEARRQSEAFLPMDAKKVKTYTPRGHPETTVDLWNSKWFAKEIPNNISKPGDLIVINNIYDGTVPVTLIGPGDNP